MLVTVFLLKLIVWVSDCRLYAGSCGCGVWWREAYVPFNTQIIKIWTMSKVDPVA